MARYSTRQTVLSHDVVGDTKLQNDYKLILQVKYVQKEQVGLKMVFNCICALSASYVVRCQQKSTIEQHFPKFPRLFHILVYDHRIKTTKRPYE